MKLTDAELVAVRNAVSHCDAAQGELEYLELVPEAQKFAELDALSSAFRKLGQEAERRAFNAAQKRWRKK